VTYDPTSNRLMIFGGSGAGGLLGDAWVLTNANGLGGTPSWSQIAATSTNFPEPRFAATAVYNPSTNKMTIFGGQVYANGPLTNDVWALSHANGL